MDASLPPHGRVDVALDAPDVGVIRPAAADTKADVRLSETSASSELVASGSRIERAVLAFVAIGVLVRVARYLTNYPVWGDEACLALSFPRRGYLDLLSPLEYGQICPILFLWAELTAVKTFGFSEMSLRLFPLICGVSSVFLFRHVAGRILKARRCSWPWPFSPYPSIPFVIAPRPSPMRPTCWSLWACWLWLSSGTPRPSAVAGSG